MKDSEKRLLHCIGWIDNELILEAEQTRFPGRRWGHVLALAACLALVVAVPLGLSRLQAPSPGPAAASNPGEVSAPAETPKAPKTEDADASIEESPVWDASEELATPVWELSYGNATILRTESLGSLYLGMPEQEILDLLQEPDATSNSGPMTYPDGSEHLTWTYYSRDLTLNLADTGDGWFLNEILMFGKGTLSLSTGVGIGAEETDVVQAYPGALVYDGESKVLEDGSWRTVQELQYVVGDRNSGLTIFLRDGLVNTITLGPWLLSPPQEAWDLLQEPEQPSYDLTSDEITIYAWAESHWDIVTVTDRSAKLVSTILTITDPEEPFQEEVKTSAWLDFHNGTAVELTGDNHATVWTYDTEALDFDQRDSLTLQFSGVFQELDETVAEVMGDPNAVWG